MSRLRLILISVCMAATDAARASQDGGRVRDGLRDILARPEYHRKFASSTTSDMWAKLFRAVSDFFTWFGKLTSLGHGTAGKVASIVFSCLVILAFLALLALVVRKLAAHAHTTAYGEHDIDLDRYDLPSARPLINEAARLADKGDYRGAFRCAYLASISHLDEQQALKFERSRTNWEYMRQLQNGGHEGPYGELQPLTVEFDRKFYGREECNRQDYEKAVAAYNKITSEAAA